MDTVSVDIGLLAVEVSGCRRCDRAKCQGCKRPIGALLAAEARPVRCEHCGKADPLAATDQAA